MAPANCGIDFYVCTCRGTHERNHIHKSRGAQVVVLRPRQQTLRSLLLSKIQHRLYMVSRIMKTSAQISDEWENTPLRGKVLTWYYYNRVMARALMQNLGTELKRLDKLRASANNSTAPNPSPPHASIFAKKEKGKGALLKKLPPHTNKQKPHA